jgi:aldehyde dehydrogenase (NAD(P)+)
MQPQVTLANLPEHVAVAFRKPDASGGVALVLGAGNIASIPPLDVLYELIAENRVAICKLNPVNEYLGPIFERIFAPLIEQGFVAFVYGGADVGERLVNDARVTKVHITGSAQSHDVIVYGRGDEAAARKAKKDPKLTKPITSELGGVGPTIVVPGPWSDADLRFQAEHVATQKLHNAGFNCIAAQVLVLHQEWDLKDRFLAALEEVVKQQPTRPAYYPGAQDRQRSALAQHPEGQTLGGEVPRTRLPGLDPQKETWAFQNEFFGSVWAETALSAKDAGSFLEAAVQFANTRLMGTLGAQIIIHPQTARELGPRLEQAIADLRYGTIGINAWSGVGFLISTAAWGAFPGHPLEDIQSGRGVVHNAFLLDQTQKTVVRAPFAPFPRALSLGEVHMSPKPAWFVTNKNGATLGRLLAQFEAAPSFLKLPAIFAAALTG